MAKKRGKPKAKSKAVSRKSPKKAKLPRITLQKTSQKPISIIAEKPKPMKETLRELEILAEEKKVEQKVDDIGKKEEAIEQKETAIITQEKKIEKETEKVEKLEKDIKKEVAARPLRKFTIKDLNKGIIGAFIGVVAHFAFIYGKQIASDITIVRATILLVFSYILIIILMYETGYREIREKRLLGILPKRATAIYITSLVMIPIIFFLFNQLDISNMAELYKQIAVTSVLSSVGAGTADLIGRD
ncbi:DUF2391 family protein [Candidatus Woesearchaeota archaeon]|nr:DUF2391 family protein [Candidatus Woesearchaeota archaeon]